MTPLLDSVHSSPHEKANLSPQVGSGALQRVSTRSFSRAALGGQPPDWRVWRERVARVLSDVSLPVFSPSHLSLSLILFFFLSSGLDRRPSAPGSFSKKSIW